MTNQPMPTAGGSYLRDPSTGALTLIEGSQTEKAPLAQQQVATVAVAPQGPVEAAVEAAVEMTSPAVPEARGKTVKGA